MPADLFARSDALISDCGRYRYWLSRTWDDSLEPVVWCMLNPSTADAMEDDPTIKKCMKFAESWGHGGIVVVNLFAWRATKPRELLRCDAPIGPDTDRHIIQAVQGRHVIAAWGAIHKRHTARAEAVGQLLLRYSPTVWALKFTDGGQPWHPLFVRGDNGRVLFRSAAACRR